MYNFSAIGAATLTSFWLLEYIYHHLSHDIPLPKIFLLMIGVVLIIFVLIYFIAEEDIVKGNFS